MDDDERFRRKATRIVIGVAFSEPRLSATTARRDGTAKVVRVLGEERGQKDEKAPFGGQGLLILEKGRRHRGEGGEASLFVEG